MRSKNLMCMVPLVLGLLLGGCSRVSAPKPDCDILRDYQKLVAEKASQDKLLVLIAGDSPTLAVATAVADHGVRSGTISWGRDWTKCNASIENDVVTRIGARIQYDIGGLIECFGAPEKYRVCYEYGGSRGYTMGLDMIYPQLGIYVFGYTFHRPPPSSAHLALDDQFPMYSMIIRPPADSDEILHWMYGGDEALYEQMRHEFLPWPGTIDQVDVLVDPYVLDYWRNHGQGGRE